MKASKVLLYILLFVCAIFMLLCGLIVAFATEMREGLEFMRYVLVLLYSAQAAWLVFLAIRDIRIEIKTTKEENKYEKESNC